MGTGEDRRRPEPGRGQVLIMAFVFEGGLLVLWVFLASLLDMPPPSQGKTSWRALLQGIAATIPLFPLLWLLVRSGAGPAKRLMRTVEELLVPVMRPLTVPDFVIISLLAGVGEEGVFRGILQGYLSGVLGEVPALAAAAALFGLLHFITPLYAILATAMGLYLGWLFLATGNLVVPMIVHALYDLTALLYLVRLRPGGERTATGERGTS